MANIEIHNDQLVLQFSILEQLGGLRSGATVKLRDIISVEKADNPWDILEGLRVGTGFPWVVVLGTMLRRHGNDVVAIYGNNPAVVITLRSGSSYQRLIATVSHPDQVVAAVQVALQKTAAVE